MPGDLILFGNAFFMPVSTVEFRVVVNFSWRMRPPYKTGEAEASPAFHYDFLSGAGVGGVVGFATGVAAVRPRLVA